MPVVKNSDDVTIPTLFQTYLDMALVVSRRAECSRRQVGAVLVAPSGNISIGWNQLPGTDSCLLQGDCPRGRLSYEECAEFSSYSGNCEAKHAEEMAVKGMSSSEQDGLILFVTDDPCPQCREFLLSTNVSLIIWPSGQYYNEVS